MADNVGLSLEDHLRQIPNSQPDNEFEDSSNNDNDFQDAQQSPDHPLRRSTRNRRPPGEWYIGDNALNKALLAQEVPTSYRKAINPESIAFCQPGIDREHDCLNRNKTWELIDYSHGMKVHLASTSSKSKKTNLNFVQLHQAVDKYMASTTTKHLHQQLL